MNKNTLVIAILTGLALAAPALHADDRQGEHSHNESFQYIDASGNVQFIGASGAAQQQDMHQADHTQHAYSNHAATNSHGYTDNTNQQETYAADGQSYGPAQSEQPEVVYYDAETGEPVPASLVGTEYMETNATGANPPAQTANNYSTQNTVQQQPAYAEQAYTRQPEQPEQPGEDFIYVDAVTGETLTREEAEAALAHQNGNAGQQNMAGYNANTAPQTDYSTQNNNNSYTTYNANASQPANTNQNTSQAIAGTALPPMPQNTAGSGYEMYSNTSASSAVTKTAETDQYYLAAQQAQSARADKAVVERAVKEGNLDLLRNLHAKGANLLQADGEGMTYLHKAAAAGKLDIVTFLLRAGIDPNARTVKDWTPLHHAARFGRAEVVKQLLAAGANPRQNNSDGFNPAQLAVNVQQMQVAALLR